MKLNILNGLIFICAICFSNIVSAQELSNADIQKIDKLIDVKHNMQANNELKNTYRLQIFSGSLEKAKETRSDYKTLEIDVESMIIYEEPNYKVWVGHFRNRIEADRTYEKIKEVYPNALIIRPGK